MRDPAKDGVACLLQLCRSRRRESAGQVWAVAGRKQVVARLVGRLGAAAFAVAVVAARVLVPGCGFSGR